MLKLLKWPLGIFILVVSAWGSYQLMLKWRFDTDAPEADFPPPADLAEARRQDVEHLALFFEHERSWTPDTLAAARAEYQALQASAESMSDAEFELGVAKVVAAASNAHTKVREYSRTPRYNRLPIRGYWFADGYHVIRAYQDYYDLLGYRILMIEGRTFEEVSEALRIYVGGPIGTFRKYLPYLLESPQLMHAAGLAASPDSLEVTFDNPGDPLDSGPRTVRFSHPFPPSEEQIARSHVLLTSTVYARSQPKWKPAAGNVEATPVFLEFPTQQMQMREMPDLEASYLQFWTNSNVGDTSIKDFCDEALEKYRARPNRNLIVDHRFNGGGNMGLTRSCMEELATSVPDEGKLYVIVGGATFSAGMYSAALLITGGGDKTVVVGEAMGDSMVSWGEDNLLRLPNSKIDIKFSTGKHDLSGPCGDWKQCHWSTRNLNVGLKSLDPDIHAPLTYADFLSNLDTAMEAIRRHQAQ